MNITRISWDKAWETRNEGDSK